jgi:peptidoglycan/xylan/chitin deacetylase (PgdA/CDA1 family)
MRSTTLAFLFAALAGPPVAAVAPISPVPLSLAWGVVAEPATPGAHSPGQVAEHLEFLQAHGWLALRARDLRSLGNPGNPGNPGNTASGERSVLLTFDDPASALRYVVPLLDLYRMPAVVTVSPSQSADPALAPVLADLAASPWMELLPRVEMEPAEAGAPAVRCGAAEPVRPGEDRLSRLSRTLAAQVARLREITGVAPTAVAWAPGTWSGSEEAVAASLGLTVSLPTFTGMPPPLDPPRLARYAVPPWAGIWSLVQASVRWDPRDHPVRFVEVDAAWICAGGDPQARIARVVEVVRRLGLNGVRLLPGDREGAWFETTAAPVLGDVAGPLSRALRDAGARWVMVDFPSASGDPDLDVALAADLARAVDADVAVLPASAGPQDRLGDTVRYVRPAARLAWRGREGDGERAFHLAPAAPGEAVSQGLTVSSMAVAAADAEASRRAIAGWEWIGLPVELAEAGLRISLRSLAAFALPR